MANTGFLIQPQLKKEVVTSDYANLAAFPTTGSAGVFYKALDTGLVYWWQSGAYETVNPALDANNELCQESGLPQATMANPTDSPTYRIMNTDTCPVDPSDEVYLTIYGEYFGTPLNKFTFTVTLSSALSEDILINFSASYKEDGVTKIVGGISGIYLTAGTSSDTLDVPNDITIGSDVTDITVYDIIVSPNPAGGKTIIY